MKSTEFAVGLAVPPGQKKQQGAVGIIIHDLLDRASDAQPPFLPTIFSNLTTQKARSALHPPTLR